MGLFKKREPEPYKEPEPMDKPTAGTPQPIYTIKPSVGTTTQKFFTYADIPGAIPKQKPEQDWIAIDTLKLSERIEKLEQQVKQLSEQVEKPQFYIDWMESVIEEHVDEYHTEPVPQDEALVPWDFGKWHAETGKWQPVTRGGMQIEGFRYLSDNPCYQYVGYVNEMIATWYEDGSYIEKTMHPLDITHMRKIQS
jgi:hypothetical protein